MAIPIDLSKLTKEERLELFEAVKDSLEKEKETKEFSDYEKKMIEERLEAYQRNPDNVFSWEEVKKRIKRKK